MAQYGFQPPFRKTPEGIYLQQPYAPGDLDAENEARDECMQDCDDIFDLFTTQQTNPDLYVDQRLVAVQCLELHGFVFKGYSTKDFERDRLADTFPFDKYEIGANNCLWAAGYVYAKL
jgi:hypothetical protein